MTKLISLKNKFQFDFVNKNGRKFFGQKLIIVYCPTNKFSQSFTTFEEDRLKSSKIYYGVKISRKYGNAIKRNLLKRRIKHLLQQSDLSDYCLIFIPKKDVGLISYEKILNDLSNLKNKLA